MEDGDEEYVQHHIDYRGKAEIVERMLRISRRLQRTGSHIVKDIEECPEEIDAQIDGCVGNDLGRGVHGS